MCVFKDALVLTIGLDFIGDAGVLATCGLRCVLFVEPFALFCCLVCFQDGEAGTSRKTPPVSFFISGD